MRTTRRTRRAIATVVATALLTLAGLLLGAAPASAHANVVGTSPQEGSVLATAPTEATVTFDEPVRVQQDAAHLFDATGRELPTTAAAEDTTVRIALPDGLGDGTYVITWGVISDDGHPINGTITFSIGAPSGHVAASDLVSAPSTGLRIGLYLLQAVMYLGLFVTIGLVFFTMLLLPRTDGTEEPATALLRVARRAAWPAGVAAVLTPPIAAAYQNNLGIGGLFSAVPWRTMWWSNETVAALVVVIGLLATVINARADRSDRINAVVAGVVTLAALSLVGHTRATKPFALMVVADVAHVSAGAVWVGGLVGLTLAVRRLAGTPGLLATTLARFSTTAAVLLVVVAGSGLVMAHRILGSPEKLLGTPFGRVLIAKVALVAIAVALAAWNRYRVLPTALDAEDQAASAQRLRRTIGVEALILAAVLSVTGVLVSQSPTLASPTPTGSSPAEPAAPAATQTFDATTAAGDVRAVFTLSPGRVGTNTITVRFEDADGAPIDPYRPPVLSLVNDEITLRAPDVTTDAEGTATTEVIIPRPGEWTVRVSVRVSEFENPVLGAPATIRQ